MVEKVACDLTGRIHGLTGAVFRYEVLERLNRSASRRNVTVLAFGFGAHELRLVLEGTSDDITNVLRGLKVGTTRAARKWHLRLQTGPNQRSTVTQSELVEAVTWAHTAPENTAKEGPLADPWSSHRDLMGFREARFFDAKHLKRRVDPLIVHAAAGGTPLPAGWPPPNGGFEDLTLLLRISGGVLGVLPADRRCFRLFVHLARARGWDNATLAPALALTQRRIRQLARGHNEQLSLALQALGDPRLCCVP
jgi:hypothetical protein